MVDEGRNLREPGFQSLSWARRALKLGERLDSEPWPGPTEAVRVLEIGHSDGKVLPARLNRRRCIVTLACTLSSSQLLSRQVNGLASVRFRVTACFCKLCGISVDFQVCSSGSLIQIGGRICKQEVAGSNPASSTNLKLI